MTTKTFFKTAAVTNTVAFVATVLLLSACTPETPQEPYVTPTAEQSTSAPSQTSETGTEAAEDYSYEGELPASITDVFGEEHSRAGVAAALSAAEELAHQDSLYNASRAISEQDVMAVEHLFTPVAYTALVQDLSSGATNLEYLLLNPGTERAVTVEDGSVLILGTEAPVTEFVGDARVTNVEDVNGLPGLQVTYTMNIALSGTVDGQAREVVLVQDGTYRMVPQGDGWAIDFFQHDRSFAPAGA